jgi:hypothetical protein
MRPVSAEGYRCGMRRSSGPRKQAQFRDRVAAFQEQAAEVRTHDLVADRNSYSTGMRLPTGARERHRRDTKLSRAEQRELASLLRPFLAQDDLCSLRQMFRLFGKACLDADLRSEMATIRESNRPLRGSLTISYGPTMADGPIAAELTGQELADVLLYGDGLLHRTAEQHALLALLRKLGGTGAEDWARQALTCLFYDTGITVLRVDDLLATAFERNAIAG